jgi:hypothetical protein
MKYVRYWSKRFFPLLQHYLIVAIEDTIKHLIAAVIAGGAVGVGCYVAISVYRWLA